MIRRPAAALALLLGVLLSAIPTAPALAQTVTMVEVYKSEREMVLKGADGAVLRRYQVALGDQPIGHKQQEGDERTPEGRYVIDWRNPKSAYHRSLHISYPNKADRERATQAGVDPGGMIMIHGLPNGLSWIGKTHVQRDWTDGCIAVTSEEIEEIWSMVADGTPIEIFP